MSGFLSDQFNNDPVSTTVQTTSYTVPGGGYARVRVTDLTTDFKLDTVIAIPKLLHTGSSSTFTPGTKFTNTTNRTLIGLVIASNTTGSVDVIPDINPYSGVTQSLGSGTDNMGVTLPPGGSLSIGTTSGGTLSWQFTAIDPSNELTFWVPEGTLIEGTKFVVELYNKQGA